MNLLTYGWIDLHAVIVKEDSISHQTIADLLTYVCINLPTAIIKEDSISHQARIGFVYMWLG